MQSEPLAYFITFSTRASRLHGDPKGSVDRRHNRYGEPLLPPGQRLANSRDCTATPVRLGKLAREAVAEAIRTTASHRNWKMHALAVQSNHVHAVITADTTPELVMKALKSWSTRALRANSHIDAESQPWTRHGSTKYLWSENDLISAMNYVLLEQNRRERFQTHSPSGHLGQYEGPTKKSEPRP